MMLPRIGQVLRSFRFRYASASGQISCSILFFTFEILPAN